MSCSSAEEVVHLLEQLREREREGETSYSVWNGFLDVRSRRKNRMTEINLHRSHGLLPLYSKGRLEKQDECMCDERFSFLFFFFVSYVAN